MVLIKMKGREVASHLIPIRPPGSGRAKRGNETEVRVDDERGFRRILMGVVDRGWKYLDEVYLRDLERGIEWVMVG